MNSSGAKRHRTVIQSHAVVPGFSGEQPQNLRSTPVRPGWLARFTVRTLLPPPRPAQSQIAVPGGGGKSRVDKPGPLCSRSRAFGNACRAFGSRCRRLWSPGRALGSGCRAFGRRCWRRWESLPRARERLPNAREPLPKARPALPNARERLPKARQPLPNPVLPSKNPIFGLGPPFQPPLHRGTGLNPIYRETRPPPLGLMVILDGLPRVIAVLQPLGWMI